MEHTFDSLKTQNVTQLREIAEGIGSDKIQGFKTLHKDELILKICEALGIEAHEHHDVVGLDKTKVKAQIHALKKKRAEALEAHDAKQLKWMRLNIKRLKQKIRRATV